MYTGKTTYQDSNEDMKKTVQVVKALCEPFSGTFRTVYIDRFYTSIDVMKELDKMDLFVTGTVMKSRIPNDLTIAKSSRQFKTMARGDFNRHVYTYQYSNTKKTYHGWC